MLHLKRYEITISPNDIRILIYLFVQVRVRRTRQQVDEDQQARLHPVSPELDPTGGGGHPTTGKHVGGETSRDQVVLALD